MLKSPVHNVEDVPRLYRQKSGDRSPIPALCEADMEKCFFEAAVLHLRLYEAYSLAIIARRLIAPKMAEIN